MAHGYTLHDRRNDLARVYGYLPAARQILSRMLHMYHNTFNRAWGMATRANTIIPDAFPEYMPGSARKPIEDWRALGVEYAIMPFAEMIDDPNIYYPNETTVLKSYPPDSNFRGPDMVVLRLYPMQHAHDGQLGSIQLVGYDINATKLQAGDELVFRHYWQAERPTASLHHVYQSLAG